MLVCVCVCVDIFVAVLPLQSLDESLRIIVQTNL